MSGEIIGHLVRLLSRVAYNERQTEQTGFNFARDRGAQDFDIQALGVEINTTGNAT